MTSPPSAPVCAHGNNPEYCIHCVHIEPLSAPDLVARLRRALEGNNDTYFLWETAKEAADQLESYRTAYGLINQRLLDATAEIERLHHIMSTADGMLFDNPSECKNCKRVRAYFQREALRGAGEKT